MAVPPSSSSFHYGFDYDVFLSFRGKDTRFDFTSNLYKALDDSGIRTFIDDRELREGDEITPSHVKAIEESRIAIIVLSINYASSSFCLDELVIIINECFKAKGRLVLPVFYNIDPSHIQHQIGSYGEAIAEHEKRFQYNKEKYRDNMERLQKWKNAMQQVANLPGFHFNIGSELEHAFILRIVEEVSRKINRAPNLHVADYPVGLESQLKEVCSLLELESNEVLMVGIHGVGGIGKTTLARAVYNIIADQFEVLCFLHNVRESSNKYGLKRLQENLLSKTLGLNIKLGDVSEGIPIIKHRLHQKKVLLILDDVDTLEQLEVLVGGDDWFGSSSRVIITTRNKHLLTFHGVERTYEVQELNQRDALQLLSHRVFKQANVDPSYEELLNRAVTYASGLPLALEVVGANLLGKNKEEWKYTLDRYERIPQKEIQKILKISFDALAEYEQSVFLDIACCFKGYELTEVQDILRGHYGHEMNYHIKVLIDKSLISISLDGKVTLRPLIESMGKEIVRRESPIKPGKRSRLWNPEDIVQVLEQNTGTSETEIIHLDSPLSEVIEWDGKAFMKMEKLKTLIIKNCHFSRAPKHLPSSLRVLEWWGYPSQALPNDFKPTKVHICRISHRDPEVPPISQGVTEVSHSVPPPQNLDIVPYVSPNSQNVPEVQIPHRDPEVPPISQGVTEVSHSVPPPQNLDIVPYVSPNSQNVPEVQIPHRDPEVPPISQGVTEISQNVLEALQTFQRVTGDLVQISVRALPILQGVFQSWTTWILDGLQWTYEWVLQTFQRVTGDIVQISVGALQILQGVFQSWTTWILDGLQWTYEWVLQNLQSIYLADMTWRLVGLLSNVVGLPCYALSPSFRCVIGGWNSFKLILYGVFCLVIQTTIYCGKQFSLFDRYPWLKNFVKFGKLSLLFNRLPWLKNFPKYVVFMFIGVYSTRYDKCLNGKPEKLSMISNAAFALVSLSLSKLIKFGCEKGIFSYFLGCFAAQMYTIHWKLIFVVIFSGFPLFAMHSSSDSQPEGNHGGQVNDSSSDSRPEVGSGGGDQHVVDIDT